jgi:DNA-binding IclR family transcriptional regulator
MPQVQKAIALMEAEYREMPGLILTLREAERLLGLDQATCERAVEALTQRRFLKRTPAGAYLINRPG